MVVNQAFARPHVPIEPISNGLLSFVHSTSPGLNPTRDGNVGIRDICG